MPLSFEKRRQARIDALRKEHRTIYPPNIKAESTEKQIATKKAKALVGANKLLANIKARNLPGEGFESPTAFRQALDSCAKHLGVVVKILPSHVPCNLHGMLGCRSFDCVCSVTRVVKG